MTIPWRTRLSVLVAGTAAAVLLTEIIVTRLFSVLLFYHYSFLAVALALFGLAGGALVAVRNPIKSDRSLFQRKVRTRLLGAASALCGFGALLAAFPPRGNDLLIALFLSIVSAIPLLMLGEVLARALAIGREDINRLYAFDLVASGLAALAAIPLLGQIQGPVVLLLPAAVALLLAYAADPGHLGWTIRAFTLLVLAAILVAATRSYPLLSLRDPWIGRPVLERWNAHSRVRVADRWDGTRWITIDRTAGTQIPRVLPADGLKSPVDPRWAEWHPDPSYALGRAVSRVAIVGVGGGVDLLPALAAGATAIDGYEINGRIVELLTETLSAHTGHIRRPGVRLIHDEARHGLKHTSYEYDVIRASLIDTWAATAAGGFVLSENGLYTVEAWRLFLRRLTPSGVLATTRWYLPAAPAEAERLVALAAQALEEEGIRPARDHVVALALPSPLSDPVAKGVVHTITTMVSPQAFAQHELTALEGFAARHGGTLLLAPGRSVPVEAVTWTQLLDSTSRASKIENSPWAIDPPRDTRPFFFLQLRALDALPRPAAFATGFGPVSEITVNGVRVLLLGVILALILACLLIIAARRLTAQGVGLQSNFSRSYFAALGIGYMAVQLALHQRLSVLIGHPVETLALVIATMLVGTGLGSAAAGHRWLRRSPRLLLAIPLGATLLLVAAFPLIDWLSELRSMWAPRAAAGTLSGCMGVALGVALPTGIQHFTRGEGAVAEAWAVNGGFSVAGSALGALAGLILGSRGLAAAAVPFYVVAWLIIYLRTGQYTRHVRPEAAVLPAHGELLDPR